MLSPESRATPRPAHALPAAATRLRIPRPGSSSKRYHCAALEL